MSRFYDAVDESLSLISTRSPNQVRSRRSGGGEWHGSKSRQIPTGTTKFVPPGQVRTTTANRSSRSPPRIRVRCCLPCVVCGRYSLYSLFLPLPQPLCPLPFPSLAQHSFGFLIYAQFNLRFLFYLKLIIYYFFLLRFLLAFGN